MSAEYEAWNIRMLDHYVKELRAGRHDASCEQRERFGLCGCRRRSRLAADGLAMPPTLTHNYPTCDGCDRDVWHDGEAFVCDACHTRWPSNVAPGEPGEFDDEVGDLSHSDTRFGRRLIDVVRLSDPEPGGSV